MNVPIQKTLLSILAAAAVICLAIITISQRRTGENASEQASLGLLRASYQLVTKSYVDGVDTKKLVTGMIDGMLAVLDPHSAYLPPEPYHEMEVQMSGAFGGIGIELGMKEGRLTVIAPIDDTPAFRAGMQPNDHIVAIDGVPTHGMGIMAAVKRMRGKKGTQVTLAILRGEPARQVTFKLTRGTIRIKSVKARLLEPGYGLVRIAQFQERTSHEFRQALATLRSASNGGLKGLVIDLRYNPGGLLGAAVDVANCFIGDDLGNGNALIVSTRGRLPQANHAFLASLGEKEPRYPIIVLINGGSASASEIVAGALQDHKRALVMGTQSFGKGSVQSLFPLPGNGALKLTTALYYTPSGRSIQATGITPDIRVGTVKPVKDQKVTQGLLREKDLDNHLASPENEIQSGGGGISPHAAGEPDLARDYQLSRALELLRSLSLVRDKGYSVTR